MNSDKVQARTPWARGDKQEAGCSLCIIGIQSQPSHFLLLFSPEGIGTSIVDGAQWGVLRIRGAKVQAFLSRKFLVLAQLRRSPA